MPKLFGLAYWVAGVRRGVLCATIGGASVVFAACGALLTEAPNDDDVMDGPVPGLTPTELAAFARGDEEFERPFAPATGLGPIFNDVSCAACHSGDGRGRLENVLTRVGTHADGFLIQLGGPQIQEKAIAGAHPEAIPAGVPISRRLPPPVFGVGLIEAIPEAAILALADPNDANGDGISGRANIVDAPDYVPAYEPGAGVGRLGRFGRKAQVSTLLQQTVAAYQQDIGITSDYLPEENRNPLAGASADAVDRVPDPEIPASTVLSVVTYIRMLQPPAPGTETPRRTEGRAAFNETGCASCHVASFTTGPSPVAVLSGRTIEPYSDFLLHDMGDALADNRPDGQASGREWRTTPLWGLRVMRDFLGGHAFLMHDGRARTIEEAILMHGGEALRARDAFAALAPAKRAALLDFVESR
jgi:CxxC motif-containing protein (DUF1111 family)